MKYRKKPVVIDAVRWNGGGHITDELVALDGMCAMQIGYGDELLVHTLEGTMTAQLGDYIINGIKGELYPCKADIFEATYEAAE